MANLTIRNVEEDVVAELKKRAKAHNRSLEAELRQILSDQVKRPWRGAELLARADRIAAMTPKDVKQTDSTEIIREFRDKGR